VLDGWQVARELLDDATAYPIPLFFPSARTDADSRERGLRVGTREYITKPFDPSTLASRINETLGNARSALTEDPVAGTNGWTGSSF
jgi:DNA-binding response OmpR family regulator